MKGEYAEASNSPSSGKDEKNNEAKRPLRAYKSIAFLEKSRVETKGGQGTNAKQHGSDPRLAVTHKPPAAWCVHRERHVESVGFQQARCNLQQGWS